MGFVGLLPFPSVPMFQTFHSPETQTGRGNTATGCSCLALFPHHF